MLDRLCGYHHVLCRNLVFVVGIGEVDCRVIPSLSRYDPPDLCLGNTEPVVLVYQTFSWSVHLY